jgi:hypothetical protein
MPEPEEKDVPEQGDEGGISLTDEAFYRRGEAAKGKSADEKRADLSAKLVRVTRGEEVRDDEEEGGQPEGQAKAPAPKPEVKPAEEPPAPKPTWDKDRQQRDQERANHLKGLETQVAGAVAAVTEIKSGMADLRTLLEQRVNAGTETKADTNTAEQIADLEKLIDGLGEDPSAEGIVAGLKKAGTALKAVAATGGANSKVSPELAEMRQKVKELTDRFAAQDAAEKREAEKTQAQRDTDAQSEANERFKTLVADCDKKFGAALHNAAYARATAKLEAAGYDLNEPVPINVLENTFEAAYATLALEGKQPAARPRSTVRPDTGTGGSPAGEDDAIKPGSLKSVVAQVIRRNRGA